MKTVRIIIAGSRTFSNYELLQRKMNAITRNLDFTDLEIVSGGAKGADLLGERWAAALEIPVKRFPADWDKYGRSAGYKRNDQMREYATHLVAFSVGHSRGTEHMIRTSRTAGLEVRVVRILDPDHRSIHDEVIWM